MGDISKGVAKTLWPAKNIQKKCWSQHRFGFLASCPLGSSIEAKKRRVRGEIGGQGGNGQKIAISI
jgi:hypothetical protein